MITKYTVLNRQHTFKKLSFRCGRKISYMSEHYISSTTLTGKNVPLSGYNQS